MSKQALLRDGTDQIELVRVGPPVPVGQLEVPDDQLLPRGLIALGYFGKDVRRRDRQGKALPAREPGRDRQQC
jgi:hypothetical protein